MDLPSLLAHPSVTPNVHTAAAILVATKAAGDETTEGLRSPALDGLIAGQLATSVARPVPSLPKRQALELADALVKPLLAER